MRQWWQWDLQGLRGNAQWRGGGLRTQNVGERGLCNTVQKRNEKKKKKNISFLTCLQMRQWRWQDLQGLRGKAWWRGGGLRTWHVGKEVSPMVRKEMKKKKKNITLLACLQVQAMVAVGVGAKGKRQQQHGGLCSLRWGCSHPSCIGCGDGHCGVVVGVVAAT